MWRTTTTTIVAVVALVCSVDADSNATAATQNTTVSTTTTRPHGTFVYEAHITGVRLEDLKNKKAFLGYTPAYKIIVEPETEVRVVVFGYWLQHVEYLTYTDSNCITSEYTITAFTLHTETRIEFTMKFPDIEDDWRLCMKQKNAAEPEPVDDVRTFISTSATIPQHFLPVSVQVIILAFLFSLSALFSGLNLGLMSLSINELQLIINSGSPSEQEFAKRILPVRKNGNYLLCTILLMNVIVNSAISLLFEDLTTGTVAFVVASAGIVVFGEIVPQSVCVKNGLAVGARTVFLIRFFMIITYPLAKPISKLLDCFLGEEVERYDRKRLIEILKMEAKNETLEFAEDIKIAVGAMEIAHKTVKDVMTRIDDVFMVSEADILNQVKIAKILKKGYSRIPVHEAHNRSIIKSLLFVKDLALVKPNQNVTVKSVSDYNKHVLRFVDENMSLPELLEEFKKGDYHLAMVHRKIVQESTSFIQISECDDEEEGSVMLLTRSPPSSSSAQSQHSSTNAEKELIGLVTLEDIIEEILQAEILDETDAIMDNINRMKRKNAVYRISEALNTEVKAEQLSRGSLEAVNKFLADTFPFLGDMIDKFTLNRCIQRNVRQITVVPKYLNSHNIVVLKKGVPAKRAILVLEGTMEAHFPKSGMTFTIHPFTFFGEAAINKIYFDITAKEKTTQLQFVPDYELVAIESCRFVQLPFSILLRAHNISQLLKSLHRKKLTETTEEQIRDRKKDARLRMRSSDVPRKWSESVLEHHLVVPQKKRSTSTLHGF